MADKKISELDALSGANTADDDRLVIVDTSAGLTKSITMAEFKNAFDSGSGFVRVTGDTMTGALNVQSTITSDGLTVEGAHPDIALGETDTTNLNTGFTSASGAFQVSTINDSYNFGARVNRLNIDHATGDLSLYEDTGTTPKFFWDSSDQELEITGTGVHGIHLRQQDDNTNNSSRIFFDNSTNIWTAYSTNGTFKIASGATIGTSSGTDRLVLDSSGNVGIGTSSPVSDARLTISDASSPHIYFQRSSAGAGDAAIGMPSSAALAFYTPSDQGSVSGLSEAMRINSSGNVGIGTDSPARPLTVSTANSVPAEFDHTDGTDVWLKLNNTTQNYYIGYSGTDFVLSPDTSSRDLTIDSSGNVGIGTSSPSYPLDVVGTALFGENRTNDTSKSTRLGAAHYTTAEEPLALIVGSASNNASIVTIGGGTSQLNASTLLRFFTAVNTTTTGGTERMRIDSSGNVGIGTISPSDKLHVEGDIRVNNAIESAGNLNLEAENGSMRFQTGSGSPTEAMRIDSLGKLLFNTTVSTDPATNNATNAIRLANDTGRISASADGTQALNLNRKSSDGEIIVFRKNGTTAGSIGTFSAGGDNNLTIGGGNTRLLFAPSSDAIIPRGTSDAERDGAIDLGSSSNRFKDLYLSGDITFGDGHFIGDGNGDNLEIVSGASENILLKSAGGIISFNDASGSNEYARFDASGNLLVGKTTLEYTSNAGLILRNDGLLSAVRSGGNVVNLNRLSSDGEIIQLNKDGSQIGSIGTIVGQPYFISGSRGIRIAGNNIRPTATAGANLDNVISLGDTGQRFKDLYLSGGVYLGGTGSANHLDDYEEGTWTPTFSGGNGTLTNRGWYIKVGNVVTCGFSNLTGITAIADSAKYSITGFPFNIKADAGTGNYKFGAGASLVISDADVDSYSNFIHAARIVPNSSAAELGVHNIMGAATTTSDAFTLFATYVTT